MKKNFFFAATIMLLLVGIFACQKNLAVDVGTGTEISAKAIFSLTETSDAERSSAIIREFGGSEVPNVVDIVVDDILGGVVARAEVSLNGKVYLTDDKGKVRIEDAHILEQFGYVRVHKEGFFDGSRTFAAADAEHESIVSISIRLFPLDESTTVEAGSPSTVKVPTPYGVAQIDLSGEYLDNDGSSYAGKVLVYAKYLDPRASETNRLMPGALLGVNTQNEIVFLISYGMLNVQLIGDAGQQLQIGSPAKLRIPIRQDQLAIAPHEIPMWYFNETSGVWIEEGVGRRNGNDYVAEVSHFTTWNWDASTPGAATVFVRNIDQFGNQLPNSFVELGVPAWGAYYTGLYNGIGYHPVYVPPGQPLSLFGRYTINGTSYLSSTWSIAPRTSGNVSYWTCTITVPTFNISGFITDCSGVAVSGRVDITNGTSTISTPCSAAGGYRHSIVATSSPSISLVATTATGTSMPVSKTLTVGTNTQNISICTERIEYSINRGPLHIDNLRTNGEELTPTDMFVEAFDRSNPVAKTRIESHTLTVGRGYNYGSAAGEMEFTDFSDPSGMSPAGNGITFDLVNYPPVGGMIEINFNGNYIDNRGISKFISGKAFIKRRL